MSQNETPLVEFKESITFLPLSIKREHSQFIEESLKEITKAESIEELFLYLNPYWTFFDYALLEHLIIRHGSRKLQEEVIKYAADLKVFRRKTTVEQYIKVCPDGFRSKEPPPNFSKITCKLSRKASEYTLEELEQFRLQFCNEISLPKFAVLLASCEEGSITIVWYIPSSEVDCFRDATIQWKLISSDLLQFEVDGLFKFKFASECSGKT